MRGEGTRGTLRATDWIATDAMIYYVEDETNIRDLTIYALRQAGFEAEGFAAPGEFFEACKRRLPELILLDIMLPEMDGMEVLRILREDAQHQAPAGDDAHRQGNRVRQGERPRRRRR